MTTDNIEDANPWRSAFMGLESDIRDLSRAVQVAFLTKRDDDQGADEDGLVWFSIEHAEQRAKALQEKWESLHKEAGGE
jgi:hypothetical protein